MANNHNPNSIELIGIPGPCTKRHVQIATSYIHHLNNKVEKPVHFGHI